LAVLLVLVARSSSANDRLDEILAAMKTAGDGLRALSARFEQIHHDHILDEDETLTGVFYLKVPGRIRWEHNPPQPKVLLVEGDKIRLYNPVANQVQEFKKGQMRGAGADLLIGFGRSNAEIGKNYDANLKEEDTDVVVLELIPKPGSSASLFKAIELTMDKSRWIPVRSVFHEANRDTTTIIFKDVEVNRKLPTGAFELELPPNVEIIHDG
jgi:outer membrane lipoprotein carrier protein